MDPMANGPIFQWLLLVLVGCVSFFLKRSLARQDSLEAKVQAIETNVAINLAIVNDRELKREVQDMRVQIGILLDRDRRKRLTDYEREGEG